MKQHNLFREYLDKICEQIRWKKAHPVVTRELGDHLEDEHAALIESGLPEDEAASRAVLDMGDAALVGSQLDRVYRPRPAWGIIAITAALMILGFFARIYIVDAVGTLHVVDIPRSVFWLIAAIIVMVTGYFLDYTILGKYPLIVGAGFVIMMIFIHNTIRAEVFGMTYSMHYYAAYFMVLIPVIYSAILWWWPYQGYSGLLLAYLALVVIVLFSQTIQAFFYGPICGLMLTVEMLKGRFNIKKSIGLLILYTPVAAFLLWLIRNSSIIDRIKIVFNPKLEPYGAGFAGVQILEVLDSSRWIGTGSHTTQNVPSLINDFMLTFYIHEFGWISLAVVLLLFGALLVFSFMHISKQKSRLGRMVALTILICLTVKGGWFILTNLGISMFNFLTFPLLSYGNAPLIVDSFLIGLMLSVFRSGDVVRDPVIAPKRIPRIKITMERLP